MRALLVALLLVGCVHAPKTPPPTLAPVDENARRVTFLGNEPLPGELYVCRVETEGKPEDLKCIDFDFFMRQYVEQNR